MIMFEAIYCAALHVLSIIESKVTCVVLCLGKIIIYIDIIE